MLLDAAINNLVKALVSSKTKFLGPLARGLGNVELVKFHAAARAVPLRQQDIQPFIIAEIRTNWQESFEDQLGEKNWREV